MFADHTHIISITITTDRETNLTIRNFTLLRNTFRFFRVWDKSREADVTLNCISIIIPSIIIAADTIFNTITYLWRIVKGFTGLVCC